jgi:hypothetical protein
VSIFVFAFWLLGRGIPLWIIRVAAGASRFFTLSNPGTAPIGTADPAALQAGREHAAVAAWIEQHPDALTVN